MAIDYEIANFRCQWHRCDKKRSLVNPNILGGKVIDIVQDNVPIYFFYIDFPYKGSTAVSMTPLCRVQPSQISLQKTVCRIIREDIRKKVRGNGTAVQPTLSIIFANSKPYSKSVSGTQGNFFYTKTEAENLVSGFL
jgi:hypothetical protein